MIEFSLFVIKIFTMEDFQAIYIHEIILYFHLTKINLNLSLAVAGSKHKRELWIICMDWTNRVGLRSLSFLLMGSFTLRPQQAGISLIGFS